MASTTAPRLGNAVSAGHRPRLVILIKVANATEAVENIKTVAPRFFLTFYRDTTYTQCNLDRDAFAELIIQQLLVKLPIIVGLASLLLGCFKNIK